MSLQSTAISWVIVLMGWVQPARAAPEICNGADDDGDYAVDEPPLPWYADADGDGAGDPAVILWSLDCDSQPPATVLDAGDCDDANPESLPGAAEALLADGLDNDCDGTIDEDALPASLDCNVFLYQNDEDSAFLACNVLRQWPTAQAACASMGYHLATIDDVNENDTLYQSLPFNQITPYWWMGLHEESVQDNWVWETGPATFFLWGEDQPNGFGLDCGIISDNDGTWYDYGCGATQPYVCEADCRKRDAFLDEDGDGFGTPGTALQSCELPSDRSWNAEDCDDANATVVKYLWYEDADGDGAGNPLAWTAACEPPNLHVSNADDCDDASAGRFPGNEEIAGDGIDQDCDGQDLPAPSTDGSTDGTTQDPPVEDGLPIAPLDKNEPPSAVGCACSTPRPLASRSLWLLMALATALAPLRVASRSSTSPQSANG